MSSVRALLFLEIAAFKNNLRLIIKKPWRIVFYLGYILTLLGVIVPQIFLKKGTTVNWHINPELFGAIVTVFILLMIFPVLYINPKTSPFQFKMADITLLFPSPVSSRLNIGRDLIFKVFLGTAIKISYPFILVYPSISTLTNLGKYPSNLRYFILGIILFIFLAGLIAYSIALLNLHYKIQPLISKLVTVLLIAIISYLVYLGWPWSDPVQSFYKSFNNPALNNIPVIGWLRALIIAPLFPVNNLFLLLTGEVLFTLFLVGLTIYLGRDYYEFAEEGTLKSAEIKDIAMEDFTENNLMERLKKKEIKREIKLNSTLTGSWSLLWLNIIKAKRLNGYVFPLKKLVIYIIIGVIAGYFVNLGKIPKEAVIAGAISTSLAAGGLGVLEQHLKKQYIYIIPGQAWQKVSACIALPLFSSAIVYAGLFLALGTVAHIKTVEVIFYYLLIISFIAVNLFNGIFAYILVPHRFDRQTVYPIVKTTVLVFLVIPALAVGGITYYTTRNRNITILITAIVNFIAVIVIMAFIDKLFGKLEIE